MTSLLHRQRVHAGPRPLGSGLNLAHPFANDCVILCVCETGIRTKRIYDSSVQRYRVTFNTTPDVLAWKYAPSLGRHSYYAEGTAAGYGSVTNTQTNGRMQCLNGVVTLAFWMYELQAVSNMWLGLGFYGTSYCGYSVGALDNSVPYRTLVANVGTYEMVYYDDARDIAVPSILTWHHYVLTSDTVALNMYIDGVRVSSLLWATDLHAYSPLPDATSKNFYIGTPSGPQAYFADVMAFNRALDPTDIASLATPSNTLLNIGGAPLLSPPRRISFPAAAAASSRRRRLICTE